ncbi:hypothetical protein SO694_00144062 [Aureococcus anophagefferens]|uniref:HIG1 domain-containing protein n=1 Tax=Aureococcus anophagefferens TaxID=44056 RepID=A0ABR1FPN4_AURAN
MTASTVIVMATMSFVVMGIRMATGHLMLRRFFYFISVIQFLFFALIVIQTHAGSADHDASDAGDAAAERAGYAGVPRRRRARGAGDDVEGGGGV